MDPLTHQITHARIHMPPPIRLPRAKRHPEFQNRDCPVFKWQELEPARTRWSSVQRLAVLCAFVIGMALGCYGTIRRGNVELNAALDKAKALQAIVDQRGPVVTVK